MQPAKNIWYVTHPTYIFNEDVKALAREARLIVVDPEGAPGQPNSADEVPALTIRSEYLPPADDLPAEGEAKEDQDAEHPAEPATKGKGKSGKHKAEAQSADQE